MSAPRSAHTWRTGTTPWRTPEMTELFEAISRWSRAEEVEAFLRDLCTLSELEAMAHRWQVARLLEQGLPYLEIAQRTGASTTTVTRVAHWLRHGEGGYRLALDRPKAHGVDRLTIAVPVKGRLREPSVSLLEDAGLGPEEPGERALAFPCRNAPVDVLLVRAADIPEYVQDGVVDCGITGARPRARARRRRRRAAPARLRLVPARGGRARGVGATSALEDLEGATVATVYPRLDARAAAGRRSSSSTSPARSRSRRGSGSPTRSSTSSRPGTRCGRTGCARSARSSRRRRC